MSVNIIAQIVGNKNYTLFQDEFNISGRTWNAVTYKENRNKWKAFLGSTGITHGKTEHQAYQRSQAVFDNTNEMMLLIADYVSDTDLNCDDLEKPQGTNCRIDTAYNIRYLSGVIESVANSFLYGYFEIRCKMPVHKGAFPAFWLYNSKRSGSDTFYEEIDIFEYSWEITKQLYNPDSHGDGDSRCYTMGMYYNTTGNSDNIKKCSVAKKRSRLSDECPSMNDWNVFGCLWMPDKVEWYINGEMVNSYYDMDSIPRHELYLIANYAINSYAYDKDEKEFYDNCDTMYIDYIRAYQPVWNCDQDVVIETRNDLDNYEYGIKKTVTIRTNNNNIPINITANDNIDIIASESVVIEGPFAINDGAEFSIMIQKCP